VPHPVYDDPKLAPYVNEHGRLTVRPADDPFARLIQSIVSQQVSTASAQAIRDRLFAQVDVTPDGLLQASEDALRTAGLSRQKAAYCRNVAEAFQSGTVSPEALAQRPDAEVIDSLTEIKGIGVWTAKMFLMFGLGRPDVFPVEDLGIRNGMTTLFGELTRAEMTDRAARWTPHRSVASLYLWKAA